MGFWARPWLIIRVLSIASTRRSPAEGEEAGSAPGGMEPAGSESECMLDCDCECSMPSSALSAISASCGANRPASWCPHAPCLRMIQSMTAL